MQKLCFDKNYWFQLLSTKNDKNVSLFLISIALHISQPIPSNVFIFFVFDFWPIETTAANLLGLAHSHISKTTNQVSPSDEHVNNFFGRKITWFTTA